MKKHQLTFLIGFCLLLFASCRKDELLPDFIYEMTVSKETLNVIPEVRMKRLKCNPTMIGLQKVMLTGVNYQFKAVLKESLLS
ncbi:hypothetical protein [Bacteroides stercorirosoris]|uniref:hypothetical protein n=1 Tax=Bacteroides stercorirosoris TaxID=871324 RepID=UPI00216AC587|nr:hypothetical protein [Bacteroides stercorirosoris]